MILNLQQKKENQNQIKSDIKEYKEKIPKY